MTSPDDPPASDEDAIPLSDVSSLLGRADVGFVRFAPNGEISAVNDAFVEFTGYGREVLLGTSLTDHLTTVPSPLETTGRSPEPAGDGA